MFDRFGENGSHRIQSDRSKWLANRQIKVAVSGVVYHHFYYGLNWRGNIPEVFFTTEVGELI